MRRHPTDSARRCPRLPGLAVLLAIVTSACGSGNGKSSTPPFFAVLSAFPAELAPLVEQATVDETVVINGRSFRLGMLGGTRVVLGLTGIGLVNAETTTRAVLDQFAVTGVVMSAVAGSFLRIGDVAVPERWTLREGEEADVVYAADVDWLARAEEIATDRDVMLERCTVPPSSTTGETVCLPHQPMIVVGGVGLSSDPFGGTAFACRPDGGDVFGCDVVPDSTLVATKELVHSTASESSEPEPLAAEDMETAAVARQAAAHGLPFIAFRAVSDGEGDPLGLPGFPAQFFAYYRLAASNAAAATVAFLETFANE